MSFVPPKSASFEAGFLLARGERRAGWARGDFIRLALRQKEEMPTVGFSALPLSWTGCRECDSADGRSVARWKANQNELGDKKTSGSEEYIRM